MKMQHVIVDCYTDEPSGLGVPPYLGVHSRYVAGYLKDFEYLSVDDIRLWKKYNSKILEVKKSGKTNIEIYNLSKNYRDVDKILKNCKDLIIILGVHVPGKYLSARPGTLKEISELLKDVKCKKILTGPVLYGTQLYGGKFFDKKDLGDFEIKDFNFSYDEINKYCLKGSEVIEQIEDLRIIEIETSRGCPRKDHCSFCLEPLKSKFEFRKAKDILNEVRSFYEKNVKYFRIGKQSDFYSYPEAEKLLKSIRKNFKDIKVLHIDNVDPVKVNEKLTKVIVENCTSGNVAAFGVESFDRKVIKANNLNSEPEDVLKAIEIINKYGRERGENGMPKFLPGINLVYGLKNESKETFVENFNWLKKILDSNLLLRRINIRKVVIFEGTDLYKTAGDKFLKKNRKYYFSATKKIREEIDFEMLKRIVPKGTLLKELRAEVFDGNNTFLRQVGTYPLICGLKGKRLEIGKFYNLKVKDYMLRSVVVDEP